MTANGGGTSLSLAVTGNCQVAALLDPLGRMVWVCMPRPDSDPVFCGLLHRQGGEAEGGVFAIELLDAVRYEQDYVRNSAVVETLMSDAQGNQLRLTDYCPRFRERGRI